MLQLWPRRQIAFKLHPVEPLNLFLRIHIDKCVQFAIRHDVKYPALCIHILRGARQVDSHRRIALGSDHVAFHPALWTSSLGTQESRAKNDR
jgi:hypothetical protein